MKRETLINLFKEFSEEQLKIIVGKNKDYANDDALSNFKLAGNIAGISPQQQALSLIAVKVARLGVLLNNKQPVNEPVKDSILDLANYAFLLHAITKDNPATAPAETPCNNTMPFIPEVAELGITPEAYWGASKKKLKHNTKTNNTQ